MRLRLRHKLAVSLSIAALLPVAVAAWVAVSIVLRSLDSGLREQTDRQLSVGVNLVLRHVESLGQDAVQLSSERALADAIAGGADQVAEVLSRESPHLPPALAQVANAEGLVVAERVVGNPARFQGLALPANAPLIRDGLSYERKVTIVRVGEVLVVRAVAPVVDSRYVLRGVVVMSMPLDGDFADGVKGALGTNVLIFAGNAPAHSTFLDELGARYEGIRVPASLVDLVLAGHTVLARGEILGREYAIGYTPIKDLAGVNIGVFGVAVDRGPVIDARAAAMRSLVLGAAGAFVFALGLAGLLSRRLSRPLARLHRGAIAIARGDLDHRIRVDEGDEIGDLATAFNHMTAALKENQQRLAARMRELVALHDAGRAVSSVLSVDQLLRKIVDAVSRVLDVRLCAVWVVEGKPGRPLTGGGASRLRLGAGRGHGPQRRGPLSADELAELAGPLESIAREVAIARATLRVDRVADDPRRRDAAVAAGITGSLVATPFERKGQVVGVIVIGRSRDARAFSEADANLLATFADQAATAIENARLYEEVRAFNEELEQKVRLRTAELESMNQELGRALRELRDTQAQLVLSERLAGLGQLVAGVAHEINSPSAAIRGSVDALADNVERLSEASAAIAAMALPEEVRARFLRLTSELAPALAGRRVLSPAKVRRTARALTSELVGAGLSEANAARAGKALVELGASEHASELAPMLAAATDPMIPITYLKAYVYLHRSAETIGRAIHRIQRIVGSLKGYSHLDQEESRVPADIHEGIENTLALLDHELGRDIHVVRNYGKLQSASVYVDELNQVWTNLIHNAVQALDGTGTIVIETEQRGQQAVVRVIDDGKGIPADVLPRIFEPFFTTKPKGEGTGLGLGIVRHIVDKHRGTVSATSEPGRTCFEVSLPLEAAGAGRSTPAPEEGAGG